MPTEAHTGREEEELLRECEELLAQARVSTQLIQIQVVRLASELIPMLGRAADEDHRAWLASRDPALNAQVDGWLRAAQVWAELGRSNWLQLEAGVAA
jgi:hypothetical protein